MTRSTGNKKDGTTGVSVMVWAGSTLELFVPAHPAEDAARRSATNRNWINTLFILIFSFA
jgi:hypothetical protein